jgi:dihydroflavonol-4-reductase
VRALVTGGTGFVGSNLVAALVARGIGVRVLRRHGSASIALRGLACDVRVGDVLDDVDTLTAAMAGCAWVFHLAAVSDYWRHRATDRVYRVNVEGTRNVLVAARRAGAERFVFTSSLAALGVPRPGRLLDENDRFNLPPRRFPYGHSKHLAERELRLAAAAGPPVVTVNPGVVVGPRDINRVSGSMIFQALRGRLRVAPPGGVNFVAVEDVAAGHIAAAERGRVGERYILAGDNLSYRTAFATVCDVVGRPGPAVVLPRWTLPAAAVAVTALRAIVGPHLPVDGNQLRLSAAALYADGRKARGELDLPYTPFRTAIERAYAWYMRNDYLRK